MHQNSVTLDSAGAITRYFAKANLHTQQETLGEIPTTEIEVMYIVCWICILFKMFFIQKMYV